MDDAIERARGPHDVEFGELPELTRTLRALGSSRSGRGGSMQSQFFHPLLEARRRAADARTPQARVAAFDAAELTKSFERTMERIVADWADKRDSVRRALRAELRERARPYVVALDGLSQRAAMLASAGDADREAAWRGWTAQLVAVFEAADATWLSLRSVAESVRPK